MTDYNNLFTKNYEVGNTDNSFRARVENIAAATVGAYPLIALVSIIVLLVVVIYMYFKYNYEGFNPTATVRKTQSDQLFQAERDHNVVQQAKMDAGIDPNTQYMTTTSPDVDAGIMSGLTDKYLNTRDFDTAVGCANLKPITDDAWAYLKGEITKPDSDPKNPITDNDYSQIMNGVK